MDKYEESVEERIRLECKVVEMQKEAGGKALYTANELALINDPAMMKKYETEIAKFRELLHDVAEDERLISRFWENSV